MDTDGSRTHDLRSANAVPYQLGYWPIIEIMPNCQSATEFHELNFLVAPPGVEPELQE
jgi:hypothetical protein